MKNLRAARVIAIRGEGRRTYHWTSVVAPDNQQVSELTQRFQIYEEFFHDVQDLDERPRLEKEANNILVILKLPVPRTDPDSGRPSFAVIPMGIVFGREEILTVSSEELPLLRAIEAQLPQETDELDPRWLTVEMIQRMARAFLDALQVINEEIVHTENRLHHSQSNDDFFSMLSLNKILIRFTSALRGDISVLQQLLRLPVITQDEEDSEDLADALIDLQQARDMTEIYTSTITNMMDAYGGVLQTNVSNTLKVITGWTVIIAIPATVATIYGMNVPLPLQDWAYAWPTLMGGGFLLSLLAVLWFRRRHWI
ncbi:magnesium transporter CorA family protein [Acidithiobacillus acidisediminis]|jgi:magnesium transporter|uniref:magnesium transporter CorA family protein n=1 Tax=Acidithiobacillus TaxID=119977 RepID=UPI00200FB2E4|nr:magnesium transporter CorA family protein [Acidithiobacillus sp. S30A2]